MKGQILDFLEQQKPDSNGRMLQEIWHWRDSMWESQHDFIQWLFPTDESSQAVRNSPVLSDKDIAEIRDSDEAKESLRTSASRYQTFLSRNRHWVKAYDHNHLRITRVLKSLRLLVGDDEADEFKKWLGNTLGHDIFSINEKTRKYWVSS